MHRKKKETKTVDKRRVHKCEKCGGVMHKATSDEESNLPCPDCGGAPEKGHVNLIMWD